MLATHRFAAVLAAALALVTSTTVLAQDATGDEGATQEDTDTRARRVFQQGATAFSEGRYEFALAAFQEAYQLSGRAALLYNVALAHDRLRQDREALEAYEQYLAAAENVNNRAEVERRVEILRRTVAEREQAAASGTEAEPAPAVEETSLELDTTAGEPESGPGLLPWIVIGGSAAVAIGGGVLFALGMSDSASVEDAPEGATWSEYQDAADRGGLFQTLGLVGMGVGLAGIGTGVALLVLGSGGEEAPVTAYLTPNGVLVRGEM